MIYTKSNFAAPVHVDFNVRAHAPPLPPSEAEPEAKHARPANDVDLEKETDKLLLAQYVPASVLVNKELDILRFHGSTSRYLEPAGGKASLNLMKMVKEDISFDLRTLISKVKKEAVPARKDGVEIYENNKKREISLEVVPVKGNGKGHFFLVIFNEHEKASKKNKPVEPDTKTRDKRIVMLEEQLKETRNSMKAMNEEFEATKEELQSSSEEVLSSNEELQSINEELETSKEELQSTNEELTTINDELHLRNMELKVASDYAEAIIEATHESLLLLTEDMRVKKANKGFYKMFHVGQDETEGRYLFDLGNKQWDIPELHRQLKLLQSKNINFTNFEVTHEFSHIGKKTMLLNAQKLPVQGSRETQILLAIQDLTGRKNIEETLRENEERLRLLLENAADIITILNKDGTILYASPSIETILGYAPGERIGKNIYKEGAVHPEDNAIKQDMIKESIKNPSVNIYAEFRMRHKDGTYRSIEAVCCNKLDDNRIKGLIATYRDITDRKKLEKQKDEFIGIASHELKTPVTSIKAYTQLLQEIFADKKDTRSANLLGKLNSQVDRLATLIVDLLDFTRIEGGKFKFREEKYDLNDLIKQICEEMQRTTKQHSIEMKLGKTVKLTGDRYRTGQVLTNLLSNAIKYSPRADKIIVSSKVANKTATVCVQDFGLGIDKNAMNHVFERFFRVSEPALNTYPGMGLGLYIASEIVKRQGGEIWVTSEKGQGSKFCFSQPVKNNA